MSNKLKARWVAGTEYLPPFTIKQSVDALLYADKMLGEGTMNYDEATKLIIKFRETNGEMYTNMVRDEIDRQIIESIKDNEATKLIIKFRETNGEMYTNMVRDEIDRQIIESIKDAIGNEPKGT